MYADPDTRQNFTHMRTHSSSSTAPMPTTGEGLEWVFAKHGTHTSGRAELNGGRGGAVSESCNENAKYKMRKVKHRHALVLKMKLYYRARARFLREVRAPRTLA